VDKEKITLFMGDGLDFPFVIQAKVGEKEHYNWTK